MKEINSEACIERFQIEYRLRLEAKTMKAYIYSLTIFFEFVKVEPTRVSKKDIRNWLLYLSESGYKTSTICSYLIALKTFYKFCLEENYLNKNPAKEIPYPKREDKMPAYLSKGQMTLFRELVKGNVMERALIEVLFATGVRSGELMAMKKKDINWEEKSIFIPDGKGEKERIVPFSRICAEYLSAYLESRTDDLPYVFVNSRFDRPLYGQILNARFQYYSSQLGFRVTPHMLRHTFATHLVKMGMPYEMVQKLLGHDNPKTTQIYTRFFDEFQKEEYDQWM
ncbi:tyrosine-type recombinase/integrase [Solibacillus isronensis]|uniref:tyrosine-type recombinase/integrase n=1 Tax=Solibacillus isronensis TaxID=412383 RepID=UPI0039A12C5B